MLVVTSVNRGRVLVRDRVAWRHPEWWTLAISAAAWLLILGTSEVGNATHGAHGARVSAVAPNNPLVDAGAWLIMIAAMMLPLCVATIRATADRSLWRRRHRAIACWLAGYITPWLIIGLVLSVAATRWPFDGVLRSPRAAAFAFVVAALWQVSPVRARALRLCHRVRPLAPAGWRATCDCLRYGWSTGVYCSITCGALMVACWLLGHGAAGLFAMTTATIIGFAERYMIRPNQRQLAVAIAMLAAVPAATAFDTVFEADDARIVQTAIQVPEANGIAERCVRPVRSECPDWLLIVSAHHLERALTVVIDHYSVHRAPKPAAGAAQRPASDRTLTRRTITGCDQRDRLGGLLHEYQRAA